MQNNCNHELPVTFFVIDIDEQDEVIEISAKAKCLFKGYLKVPQNHENHKLEIENGKVKKNGTLIETDYLRRSTNEDETLSNGFPLTKETKIDLFENGKKINHFYLPVGFTIFPPPMSLDSQESLEYLQSYTASHPV